MNKSYLLIDGNNLAIRCAFANAELRNEQGIPSGLHYGVLQSLVALTKKWPEAQKLVVWDGKSHRRIREAREGVKKGIIPNGYKENRPNDTPLPLQDFLLQNNYLKRAITAAGIPQIWYEEYEADDVIASYAKTLPSDHTIILVTADKDYYQLLDHHIMVWDGMNLKEVTMQSFRNQYPGLEPHQMIDMGALQGDHSDNIYGLPSWGEKTAYKYLVKHQSAKGVIQALDQKHKHLRDKYPDPLDFEKFKKLQEIRTKSNRVKYPGLRNDMPYIGVLSALEYGSLKKVPKVEILALVYQERVPLAYDLKKMDDVPDLPMIANETVDEDKLNEFCTFYDIRALRADLPLLWGGEPMIESMANKAEEWAIDESIEEVENLTMND